MKRKLLYVVIILMVFGVASCIHSNIRMKMMKVAVGDPVKNAAAVYDELGIDISMPEKIIGAWGFKYSILNDKIGQVGFYYFGTKYYLQAAKEEVFFEEMGITDKGDNWGVTTLYAGGDTHMTGISWQDVKGGGSVVSWSWHGIYFSLVSSAAGEQNGFPADEIASDSYYQPMIEEQTAEE